MKTHQKLIFLNALSLLSFVLLAVIANSYNNSDGSTALGLTLVPAYIILVPIWLVTFVADLRLILSAADKKLNLGWRHTPVPHAKHVKLLLIAVIIAILYIVYLWMAGLLV
jgi:L-asparagine transporter-like permease